MMNKIIYLETWIDKKNSFFQAWNILEAGWNISMSVNGERWCNTENLRENEDSIKAHVESGTASGHNCHSLSHSTSLRSPRLWAQDTYLIPDPPKHRRNELLLLIYVYNNISLCIQNKKQHEITLRLHFCAVAGKED